MKKRFLNALALLILVVSITGCNTKNETKELVINDNSVFAIKCTSKETNESGIKTYTVTTYYFNEEQYVTDYSIATIQKYKDVAVYKESKAAQEESYKNNTVDNVSYSLKTNDKKKTIDFIMTVRNIDVSEVDKADYKAKNILETSEDNEATCIVKGITKDRLK